MLFLRRRLAASSFRQRFFCVLYIFLFFFFFLCPCLFILWQQIGEDNYIEGRPVDAVVKEVKSRVIPRIIHQTYKSRRIPQQYWDAVTSWYRYHPNYVYYLWTDADIDRFIATEYPDYVSLFRSFRHKLQRSDAIRYFILFHYGGVYADMDVSALRPLDPLLSRFSCVISRERFEQTMFQWGRPQLLMNAVMASAPRHPFMQLVIRNLHSMWRRPHLEMTFKNWKFGEFYDIFASTGPMAITDLFERYPPCRKGTSAACDIYLAPPEEMLPRIPPGLLEFLQDTCKSFYYRNLKSFIHKYIQRRWDVMACKMIEEKDFDNYVPIEAFTDHGWSHLGYFPTDKSWTFRDISELVGEESSSVSSPSDSRN